MVLSPSRTEWNHSRGRIAREPHAGFAALPSRGSQPFARRVRTKQRTRLPTSPTMVAIDSLDQLASLLGLPKYVLTGYIFQADRHYQQFRIGKRSGRGYRTICAPSEALKGLQRWVTVFILRDVELHPACMAFRKGYSILSNADPHVGRGFVYNADIRDFFPSITAARVVGLFKSFGYSGEVAFGLGKLVTYGGRLPQGAPSSPDIANIVCRVLDTRLCGLSAGHGWAYTRYCDDITISGEDGFSRGMEDVVARIVRECGFDLNSRKTHVTRKGGRQVVTGLVVNTHVAIPRYLRRTWRATFHRATLEPGSYKHRLAELEGYIAYLSMVSPNDPMLPRYRKVTLELAVQPTVADDPS